MEKQTFKAARELFRKDAGVHYVKPDEKTSHFTRDAWYLLDKRGNVVCIAAPESCLWGAKLAYYYSELGRGNAVG